MNLLKLRPEVKTAWLAALRSGDYKQTSGMLQSEDGSFCCLGVLCDLSSQGSWSQMGDSDELRYMSQGGTPHKSVMEYAFENFGDPGVDGDNCVRVWAPRGTTVTLASLNDGGASFTEIACNIEEQL